MVAIFVMLARATVYVVSCYCVYMFAYRWLMDSRQRQERKKAFQRWLFVQLFRRFGEGNLSKELNLIKSELFNGLNELAGRDGVRQQGIILLEIGIGSGVNLRFFPPQTRLIVVEPNPHFEEYFNKNAANHLDIKVDRFVRGTAEDMNDVGDNTVDVVVSTHVLCSVDDPERCLKEVVRVLKPGGRFYFVEHVAYNPNTHPKLSSLQRLIEPIWMFISDDCRLTRDLTHCIAKAGFSHINETKAQLDKLPWFQGVVRPHIYGYAIK